MDKEQNNRRKEEGEDRDDELAHRRSDEAIDGVDIGHELGGDGSRGGHFVLFEGDGAEMNDKLEAELVGDIF